MLPKIALEHVTVERQTLIEGKLRPLRIVEEVNLEIAAGGRLAIFGPSGSGKTSLLRLLNRLNEPAEGQVLLDGVDLRQIDPVLLRRRVGMVFQQPFLFNQTAEENLAYPLRLQKKSLSRELAETLLAEFGLSPDFLARQGQQLSGGQQQRVALARALTLNPEVLLLDEPSSALDEESARLLMDGLLHRNAETGLTIVMVTHSPEMMTRLQGQALLVHEQHAHLFADAETALREAARERVEME